MKYILSLIFLFFGNVAFSVDLMSTSAVKSFNGCVFEKYKITNISEGAGDSGFLTLFYSTKIKSNNILFQANDLNTTSFKGTYLLPKIPEQDIGTWMFIEEFYSQGVVPHLKYLPLLEEIELQDLGLENGDFEMRNIYFEYVDTLMSKESVIGFFDKKSKMNRYMSLFEVEQK